ncbi:MAG: hypothetical protein ACQES9_01215 [Myxococcota bacterium]
MKKISITLFFIFTLSFIACGNVNFDPPSGFVEIKKTDNILKLVASDASVLKVTYRENKKNGTATFWSELLVRDLTEFKGYKLLKREKFKENSGNILHLKPPHKRQNFIYKICILANEDDVFVIELGCKKSQCENHLSSFNSLIKQIYNDEIS